MTAITTPVTTIEQVLDIELAKYCGECGEPLDPPGSQCPECQALPDETREEGRERLTADPGAITRAEVARLRQLSLEYLVAAEQGLRLADRELYRSELRQQRDQARNRLEEAVDTHERTLEVLGEAVKAEEATTGPLAGALRVHEKAARAEETARRLRKGAEIETEAAVRLTAAHQVLARYQAEAAAAARVRETAERAVLVAGQAVRDREQERDMAQLVLDRHAAVPLSGETAVLLLTPLLRMALGKDVDGRVLDAGERALVGMFGDALRGAGFADYADAVAAAEEARIRKQLEQEFANRPQLRRVGDGMLSAAWANPPKPSGGLPGGVVTPAPNLVPEGPFGRPAGGVLPRLG